MNVGVMWLLVLAVIGLSIVTGSTACIVLVIPSFFILFYVVPAGRCFQIPQYIVYNE